MCHNLHSDFLGILPVACSLRTQTLGWKHPHVVSEQSFLFLYWTQYGRRGALWPGKG
jgi:hypothetical protein